MDIQDKAMKPKYGFARWDKGALREICKKGGASVPADRRSFSADRDLASRAGRVGGNNVPPSKRTFSTNRELAAAAGRKGGKVGAKKRSGEEVVK